MQRGLTCGVGLVLMQLSGCAGNGEGLDASGRPDTGADGALTPDLASIQANVFTPICSQCHAGAGAAQGLRLDAGSSYGSLVGVPSSELPGTLRVRPGDPGGSYLVQKLEGRASVGGRMPLGLPPLADATIQVIRQWIVDGALAGSESMAVALSVDTVSSSPTTIAIALSRPVDASLIDASTVHLELLDAASDSAVPVPRTVVASADNASLILVRPLTPLAPGRYRLTLQGGDPIAVADWGGLALDGDADGQPGGNFVSMVDIETAP